MHMGAVQCPSLPSPPQVIPLARRSGLIEWCEGTVPLGEWLAGNGADRPGAHQLYRPSDLDPSQAKLKLAGVRDKGLERRYTVFMEVCSKIKWVFLFAFNNSCFLPFFY